MMRIAFLALPFLLASCTSLFHPKWAYIIHKHRYENREFKATVLHDAGILVGFLSENRDADSTSSCESGDILQSIDSGSADYFVVFKNYLAAGGENEPNDQFEALFLFKEGSEFDLTKSIYIHDWNENPHECGRVDEIRMDGNRVTLSVHGRDGWKLRKEIAFSRGGNIDLDSLKRERSVYRKMAASYLK